MNNIIEQAKNLKKELEDWKFGKMHYCSSYDKDKENCYIQFGKEEYRGEAICPDCYIGFRIREVKSEQMKQDLENELEFLKDLYAKSYGNSYITPREFLRERISQIQETLKELG